MDIDPHSLIPHLSPFTSAHQRNLIIQASPVDNFPQKVNKKRSLWTDNRCVLICPGRRFYFQLDLKISIVPFGEFWNVTNGS
jgi:hypothetical protein